MDFVSGLATFASRLKQAREKAGFTQTQLAERVGMTQGQISKLELGERQESTKTAEIAHECGVSAYWMATGKGPMRPDESGPFEVLMDDLGNEGEQMTLNFLQFQVNTNAALLGPEKAARYLQWIDKISEANKRRGK